MSNKSIVLLSAAFGGISPNLFRLAVSLTEGDAELPQLSYFLGLLIFALMGAGVAYIWEETNLKKAFYLGLGLPAFIQMSTGEISSTEVAASFMQQPAPVSSGQLTENQTAYPIRIIPASMWQDSTRTLTITLEKYIPKYTIIFSSDEDILEKIVRTRPKELSKSFPIPSFATRFQIKVSSSVSEPQPIAPEPGAILKYRVTVEESMWKGFLQALGFRDGTGLTIIVQKEEE